jgi:hypothetical protein
MLRSVFLKFLVAASVFLGPTAGALAGADENALRDEFYKTLNRTDRPTSSGEATALLITGVIGPGSYEEFRAALSHATPEIVVIDGPGGVLGEAILIGQEIRRRRLDTLVAAHHSCASACAVVFLSGANRYLGAGAEIGLHSASFVDGRADPEATALMASYLEGVGVPLATLHRMAETAPSDIRWLTKSEQRAIGIRLFKNGS